MKTSGLQSLRLLESTIKGTIIFREPMKNHTSFRIGGPADALIIPKNVEDVKNIIEIANREKILLHVMGNGTKLLVKDQGIRGIVIKICNVLNDVQFSDQAVTAGSGVLLSQLARLAADRALGGLEFAVGIPGTVGGAVVMNAGAHGRSMGDVITKVTVIDFKGSVSCLSKGELEFGYRESRLQKINVIVLSAELRLNKGDPKEIQKRMKNFLQWRKAVQPLSLPNAGCIFKNPEKNAAGRLIDLAGAKGMRIGDAEVSTSRANFIVNRGNASAQDVLNLMEIIQQMVEQKFGIKLIPEIKIVGE